VTVDGHDPADPRRGGEADGEGVAEPLRRPGNGDDGALAGLREACFLVRLTRIRRLSAAQPSANLALSVTQRAALPDNVADVDTSILPERQQ
jgi:hypothetical protein